jgi:hypothetical protein
MPARTQKKTMVERSGKTHRPRLLVAHGGLCGDFPPPATCLLEHGDPYAKRPLYLLDSNIVIGDPVDFKEGSLEPPPSLPRHPHRFSRGRYSSARQVCDYVCGDICTRIERVWHDLDYSGKYAYASFSISPLPRGMLKRDPLPRIVNV